MAVAYSLAVRPAGGDRTWTVVDASYATVGPVEEWLEAHRYLWSPNTVRGYATSLAQWWSFLEQRGEAGQWQEAGVPAVAGFLSWLRNGRTVEHALAPRDEVPTFVVRNGRDEVVTDPGNTRILAAPARCSARRPPGPGRARAG